MDVSLFYYIMWDEERKRFITLSSEHLLLTHSLCPGHLQLVSSAQLP